jgi:polyhydroxyalkanoate synthase
MIPAAALSALARARDAHVGACARDLVWSRDKLKLYRYRALAAPASVAPVLIVYALVNRPYLLDLQTDRSLIRGLLLAGLDVYLIDWGYPDGADRLLTLEDYIEGYLDACVTEVMRVGREEAVNVLGVCQGGTLSLCYAALHPSRVRNLITMVTPVDFKTPSDLLSKWVQPLDLEVWVGSGNVAGEALNQVFLSLRPFRLMQQKYVELFHSEPDVARAENFVRMEQWIFDSPDLAGTAFKQFVRWFYQQNRLVEGTLTLGGRRVGLDAIRAPILNLYGGRDHLVPPEASAALHRLVGSRDYTAREFDLGHIGMYVSARAQREVPPAIADWLAERAPTYTRRR